MLVLISFQIIRSSANGQETSLTPSLPYLLDGADVFLNITSLDSATSYDISVNPKDIFGSVSPGVSHTVDVLPDPPSIDRK